MSYLLDKPLPFTPEGRDELALEIALVETCREDILAELAGTADHESGVLRGELKAVDAQLARLRHTLSAALPVGNVGFAVAVGSEVTVADEQGTQTFTIAGPIAANPKLCCISYDSPLARALLGAELGEHVEIPWNGSHRRIRVVGIRRGRPGEGTGSGAGHRQLAPTG
jgi:transcription elongation GreA/GreB family factor